MPTRYQEAPILKEGMPRTEQLAGGGIRAGVIRYLGETGPRSPELRLTSMAPEQHLAVREVARVKIDDWRAVCRRVPFPHGRLEPGRCREGCRYSFRGCHGKTTGSSTAASTGP